MKFLVVIAVLAVAAAGVVNAQSPVQIPEEQKQRILEYAAVCSQENSVDKNVIQALKTGQFSNVDQNAKCFTNCFLEKAGLLVNGQVQNAVISAKLGGIFGADKVSAAMAQCNDIKGADNCETAFELYKCYFKTNAALI
ncbi:general odorant-binding protein 56d-like [Lucilia cuprina]|uniref:general odorant-binding protein 56d-like n=1 Tax=Lucilia cuprina TaxID=7375 RepID=UPI001F061C39|nr:general odorant-binding protein 56d-like [Lucilia cuprina]